MQLGQDQRARAIVEERNSVGELSGASRYSAHTGFAAIPVRYAIERGAWAEAAALPPPRTPYPQADAITWFGRALGAARSGDVSGAQRDLTELERRRAQLAAQHDEYWTGQVDIQATAARAWIAFAQRRTDEAIATMRAAADHEDRTEKHVAMENRLSPMRELLGELLLEAGRPADALQEFEASLHSYPNRYRSLSGAARAAELNGDREKARVFYQQLLALMANAESERSAIKSARAFLQK